MTLVELKAKAYDILANVEYLQQELVKVNQEILALSKEQSTEQEEKTE